MQDTVFIRNLEISTLIGVYEYEREQKQRVIIDLEICADLREAGSTDSLEATIDYGAIVALIESIAEGNNSMLLERFGQVICDQVFENFSVSQLTLTLNKPDIINNASGVGVVLRRKRSNNQNEE